MTLANIEKLIRLLRDNGVSHYKDLGVEVRLGVPPSLNQPAAVVPSFLPENVIPINRPPAKEPEHGGAAPPVDVAIPHHENQVKKLLKLSDEDLVEVLFPDPSKSPKDE